MSLFEVLGAVVETEASTLPFDPLVFAAITASVFAALGFIVWSYRDVANRHSHKSSGSSGHGTAEH